MKKILVSILLVSMPLSLLSVKTDREKARKHTYALKEGKVVRRVMDSDGSCGDAGTVYHYDPLTGLDGASTVFLDKDGMEKLQKECFVYSAEYASELGKFDVYQPLAEDKQTHLVFYCKPESDAYHRVEQFDHEPSLEEILERAQNEGTQIAEELLEDIFTSATNKIAELEAIKRARRLKEKREDSKEKISRMVETAIQTNEGNTQKALEGFSTLSKRGKTLDKLFNEACKELTGKVRADQVFFDILEAFADHGYQFNENHIKGAIGCTNDSTTRFPSDLVKKMVASSDVTSQRKIAKLLKEEVIPQLERDQKNESIPQKQQAALEKELEYYGEIEKFLKGKAAPKTIISMNLPQLQQSGEEVNKVNQPEGTQAGQATSDAAAKPKVVSWSNVLFKISAVPVAAIAAYFGIKYCYVKYKAWKSKKKSAPREA